MGGAVAALLQAEGRRVVRATRNPAGAGEVRFDLLEPQTFAPALQGVTAVMLMSRPGDEDAGVHAAPFVRAMQASAATREPFTFFLFAAALFLVYTSVSLWVLRWVDRRFSLGVRRGTV